MQANLKWNKGFFSNLNKIYSNDKIIGKLKTQIFSPITNGEINEKKYTFETKGFFKKHTNIIDDENKIIGKITYNIWNTKATISIYNKTINWKYNNIWGTKWSVFDNEGINIKYSGSSISGEIGSNSDTDLLLLSGLFIRDYYWKIAILVSVMVILLVK